MELVISVIDDSVCHGYSNGCFLHWDVSDENSGSYASGRVPSHVGAFLAFVYAGAYVTHGYVLDMVRRMGSLRYSHCHNDGPPGTPCSLFSLLHVG